MKGHLFMEIIHQNHKAYDSVLHEQLYWDWGSLIVWLEL